MRKVFFMIFVLFFGQLFSFEDFWQERNSQEGAKKAFETAENEFNKNQNDFQNAWKFARISHFYADNFVKDKEEKKKILDLGKIAAEKATTLKPESPEGWYWLAICLGSWGEANGVMQSLSVIKPIIEACNRGIKLNPEFEKGNFYMVRGRVYHKAPSVISVGDIKKAISDYEKTITLNPENRTAYRFYVELLVEQGNKEKAKEIIEKGLSIPLNRENILVENKEIKLLTKLKEKF